MAPEYLTRMFHVSAKLSIPGIQAQHETSPLSTPDRITNQSMENLTCSDQKLSLFLTNARSLLPKVEDLESTMSLNGVSLAFITETWLNDNIDDAAVHIPNDSVANYLDSRKAFDLVDHNLLITKLINYGIKVSHQSPIGLLTSYVSVPKESS
jgi:hypothetical protein